MLGTLGAAAFAPAGRCEMPSSGTATAVWLPRVAAGYDLFINTYALAETDTTERIAETAILVGLTGRSRGNSRRRWQIEGETSAGTQMWRERLSGEVRWRDSQGYTRWIMRGEGRARQYRTGTVYGLSSDNREGRGEVRGYPLVSGGLKLESRAWVSGRHYRTPSTLELNQQEIGGQLAVLSGEAFAQHWSLGCRTFSRVYPDSAAINRRTVRVTGTWDHHGHNTPSVRIYHRSDRRIAADPSVRPSAWTHWTDLDFQQPVHAGAVFLEAQNEVWRYDSSSGIYQNFWRLAGRLGWTWGDEWRTRWRTGFSGEWLRDQDPAESYGQYGILGGVDISGNRLLGSLLLEVGRRIYDQTDTGDLILDPALLDEWNIDTGNSDFNYGKIWLTATWELSAHFSCDLMASYEPERHGEKTDDTTLAFASARLTWRP